MCVCVRECECARVVAVMLSGLLSAAAKISDATPESLESFYVLMNLVNAQIMIFCHTSCGHMGM